jgi:uncharacterized membrane protein
VRHVFELSPNCSLTIRSAALFYVSILTASLTIAGAFAMAGFWPILPFAGLELLLLGAALCASLRRGRMREYIGISEHDVIVAGSRNGRAEEYRFARAWTRVELQPGAVPAWPSRLWLGSMGRRVEVGAFLTEGERRGLKIRLSQVIAAR